MKAFTISLTVFLLLSFLVLPIFELIALINGLDFVLNGEILTVSVQAAVILFSAITFFVIKPEFGRTERIILLLITPVSLLNALTFIDADWAYTFLIALFSCGCVFALYIKFVPDSRIKATSAVFSVLIAISIGVVYIWNVFTGIIVEREDIHVLVSPNGTYTATVYTEETPLRSNSYVEIKKNAPEAEAFVGNYHIKTKNIYEGDAYRAKTSSFSWKDEVTFTIDGNATKVE